MPQENNINNLHELNQAMLLINNPLK